VNCNDCGLAPMLLTVNDTGTVTATVAPTKIEIDEPYVPGLSPVGSAITVIADGVMAVCGFNVNQLVANVGVAKKVTEPLGLEMFKVCDTLVPLDWAEKVMDVLSTDNVWACRPAAARTPRIRQELERIRFKVNLQRWAVGRVERLLAVRLLARRLPFRSYLKNTTYRL
jgi:hypothetical protein